jgi:hypothetical protein
MEAKMNLWDWIKVRTFAPKVTRAEAISIARAEFEKRNWVWREQEPVIVKTGWSTWEVWTNANWRGGNTRIFIRKDTGEVVKVIVLPL